MIANIDAHSLETNSQIKELLLRIAGLGIYRKNSFNKLALPVRATANEIAKRQQIVDICLKTGASVPTGKGISFFQDLIPDIYKLEEATHRLQNPESRLIDEFFWFWPIPPASEESDQALSHLRKRTLEAAIAYWQNKVALDDRYGVALHNLAIYTHIWVLEQESTGSQAPRSTTFEQDVKDEWDKCYQYWQALIDCEAFWSQLSNRIREIDDPRLTTGSARRIRSLLPFFLCTTHLKIALGHAENNQFDQARRLVNYVKQSQFLGKIFGDVAHALLESHQKRLRQVCKSAETQIEASPQNAYQSADNLITIGQTSLRLLDLFSPSGVDIEMHDLVVKAALFAVRSYGLTTEKYEHCLKLLSELKPLAAGEENRNEIEGTITTIQELISKADSWCGEGYFDLPKEILDVLEKARTLAGQLKYQDAINLINELNRNYSAQLSTLNKNLVHNPLAYCLNRQAVELLNKVSDVLDRPREVFVNIGRRAQQTKQSKTIEEQFNYALWGYENNRLDYVRQSGQLYCMACGKQIRLTNFAAFMNNDLPVVICWTCNHADDQEVAQRKASVNSLMLESHKLLSRARQLNPNGNQIKENLVQIRKTASQLKITLPPDPIIAPPKSNTNSSKPTGKVAESKSVSARPKEAQKKAKPVAKSQPKNATLNFVIGIAVLIILIMAILFAIFVFASLVAFSIGSSSLVDVASYAVNFDPVLLLVHA